MRGWAERNLSAARPLGGPTAIPAAALAPLAVRCHARRGHLQRREATWSDFAGIVDALSDGDLAALRLDAAVKDLAAAPAELDLEMLRGGGSRMPSGRWLSARQPGRATSSRSSSTASRGCDGGEGELASSARLLDHAVESARLSGNRPGAWPETSSISRSRALAAGDIQLALDAAAESVPGSAGR